MTFRRIALCSLFLLPQLGGSATLALAEGEMYAAALSEIANATKARNVAVYHETLRPDELVEEKVPRHAPKGQFSRAIRGVSPDMELALLYASKARPSYRLEEFPWSAPGVRFVGFVNVSGLPNIEVATREREFEKLVLVVKFSRVAYDRARLKALVVAESGRVGATGSSGDAFLFVRNQNGWRMKASAGLWGGGPEFWRE